MSQISMRRHGRAMGAALVACALAAAPAGARKRRDAPVVRTPVPAPVGVTHPVRLRYAIEGAATVSTLTRGVLRFSGTADAALALGSKRFTANLELGEATGHFTALGVLPVVARVQIVPLEPVTGTLTPGTGLAASVRVRLRLPSVSLFGLWIGGGPDCQTRSPSVVAFKPTAPDQSPIERMTIASTFSIGAVSGCGPFTNLVAPLVAGNGNAIALSLTPIF